VLRTAPISQIVSDAPIQPSGLDERVPDLRPGEVAVPARVNRPSVSSLAAPTPTRVLAPQLVRTTRMTLRPLLGIDREPFLALVNASREHLERWVPLHDENESDDAYFDRQLRLCTEGDLSGSAWRRIGVVDDGRIAGMFNLNAISRGLSWEADAAWWLGAAFTGLGLATEGVRAMLGHALTPAPDGLGLFGVHCGIAPGNAASERVAERCGFIHQPERHSYLKVGGSWVYHEFYQCSEVPETDE
jgi:ribosomal-protein-alanine N-acetyltransferase